MGRKKNVIAPNDEKSLMAMEKMAAEIEKARELYGDGQPFEEERVLDCIVFKADRTTHEMHELGKYCLWLKAEVGHGRFIEDLQSKEINVRAAQWAMLMVEKFRDKYDTVSHLGARKARFLTTFTKEEIDAYVAGGPLGKIPHDKVTSMSSIELENEVRHLNKKLDNQAERHEKVVKEMSAELEALRLRDGYQQPPTVEQLTEAQLEKHLKPFNIQLQDAIFAMNRCVEKITEIQRIENISYIQLNNWVLKQSEDIENFTESFTELQDAINDIHIDRGEDKGGETDTDG
jgi:hypothetical protein